MDTLVIFMLGLLFLGALLLEMLVLLCMIAVGCGLVFLGVWFVGFWIHFLFTLTWPYGPGILTAIIVLVWLARKLHKQ